MNAIMTVHPGGTTTAKKMLPIRQLLNKLPGLNRTHKAVLIEVCELAMLTDRKQCTAKNEYLAERLGGTVRTISRTVSELETLGLLTSSGSGKARVLLPALPVQACFVVAGEVEQQLAFERLAQLINRRKPGQSGHVQPSQSGAVEPSQNGPFVQVGEVGNLDKIGHEPSQNGYTNLAKIGSEPSQNRSRVYRDDKTTKDDKTGEVEFARVLAALAAAEKKIGELAAKNEELAAELEKVTTQRDLLRNTVLASRTGGAGAARRSFAESKYSTPEGFAEVVGKLPHCAGAYAPYYLAEMKLKAEGLEDRDEPGWRNYVHAWLSKESGRGELVTSAPNPTSKVGSDTSEMGQRLSVVQQAKAMRRNK